MLMNLRTREIADGSSASGYDVNMDYISGSLFKNGSTW